MTDVMSESEKRVTDVVDLGVLGRVRIDNMFELYMETNLGDLLKFYQTRLVPSVGGWVYDAAACLAKYLETGHFLQSLVAPVGDSSDICKCRYPLRGKSFIELGAGTGIVGIMAGYYGADAVITDLESLVPLIQFNISANQPLMKGSVVGLPLIWGSDDHVHEAVKYLNLESFDYVVLANCVYYEGSLETLLQTTLDLTENKSTTVLACYEERTKEIKSLIARWHDMVERHFIIEDVPQDIFDSKYCKEYVRIVTMKRK